MIYKFLNIPCIAQLYLYHMVKFHGRHFGYDITQLGKPLCSELLYQLKWHCTANSKLHIGNASVTHQMFTVDNINKT